MIISSHIYVGELFVFRRFPVRSAACRRRRLIASVRSLSLHPLGGSPQNFHSLYLWGGRRFDQFLGGVRQICPTPPGPRRPQNGKFGPFSPFAGRIWTTFFHILFLGHWGTFSCASYIITRSWP